MNSEIKQNKNMNSFSAKSKWRFNTGFARGRMLYGLSVETINQQSISFHQLVFLVSNKDVTDVEY